LTPFFLFWILKLYELIFSSKRNNILYWRSFFKLKNMPIGLQEVVMTTLTVTVQDMQQRLGELLSLVSKGNTIIIEKIKNLLLAW
jgi:hypothetical protein